MIRLKKLVAYGALPDGSPIESPIEFGSKLTVITGPSDTGKTSIYNCLDYVLGKEWKKKENPPFGKANGYNRIGLVFETQYGEISISRLVGKNFCDVVSSNEEIPSGRYWIKRDKNKDRPTLTWLFGKLVGIDSNTLFPKNKDGGADRFSWREYKNFIMVSESKTESGDSIFLREKTKSTTYVLSHLLKFLYDTDLSKFVSDGDSPAVKKAKKEAVALFVTGKEGYVQKKIESLQQQLAGLGIDGTMDASTADSLNAMIDELNGKVAAYAEESSLLMDQIAEAKANLNELLLAQASYVSLRSDLEADIRRLGFVVDGRKHVAEPNAHVLCPICSGEIHVESTKNLVSSARAELRKAIASLNELSESESDVEALIQECKQNVASLEAQMEQKRRVIEEEIKPKIKKYTALLQNFEHYSLIQGQLNELRQMETDYAAQVQAEEAQESEDSKDSYDPKRLFPDDFKDQMARIFRDIITLTGYPEINSVEFDMSAFDIVLNENRKEYGYGKGMKAFINSLMILTLRKYALEVESQHIPGFYFIDSPVHDLTLPKNWTGTENDIRKMLFKYLNDLEETDQLIVIENSTDDELDTIDESRADTIIHRFTKDDLQGKYGFLVRFK